MRQVRAGSERPSPPWQPSRVVITCGHPFLLANGTHPGLRAFHRNPQEARRRRAEHTCIHEKRAWWQAPGG
eukprot:scaffold51634_cov219-Isochrysis_galbana.AAC.2